jgi:hypothetical protein
LAGAPAFSTFTPFILADLWRLKMEELGEIFWMSIGWSRRNCAVELITRLGVLLILNARHQHAAYSSMLEL